ncbi:MAG: hypothetical protein HUU55_18015, partial [Myxococcales bacterium]|nr:hypothetical protein [Myxococcales bacterium]
DVCTNDQCVGGLCEYTNNTEPCDDGDACTENDTCDSGNCAGTQLDCDDSNECTDDQCVAGLCENIDNVAACDDGDACTENDVCGNGSCAGTPIDCDDGDVCTNEQCVAGLCEYTNNTEPCDDGDACTENDTCDSGNCAGTQLDCDDSNECTTDSCDAGLCVNDFNTNPCDDGDVCTTTDSCENGVCVGSDVQDCNDDVFCTQDFCDQNHPDAAPNGCVNDGFAQFGQICDDNDECTFPDVCDFDGNCTPGFVQDCDDDNECTADSCDSAIGCVHDGAPLLGATCTDLNACTDADSCDGNGVCVPGEPVVCDDDNPCTDDLCDSGAGCQFTNNSDSCDDGDPFTTGDTCIDGICQGTGVNCDDGDPCTDDNYNPIEEACEYAQNTAVCDDGNPCTVNDVCAAGLCAGSPKDCSTNNPCLSGSCQAGTGACVLLPDFSDPTCLPENAFCAVSGAAGNEVLCPILLARATFLTPIPAGAQWQINFDPAVVGLVGYQDEICVGPGNCNTVDVPPGALSSGHGLTLIPGDITTWPGSGHTFALNVGDPTAGLSDAFLSGPNLVGLALIAELKVQLLQDIDPSSPVFLEYGDVEGTTVDAAVMTGSVDAGVIILALADCTAQPDSCEDGDPCTVNSCDAETGTCISEPVDCSDGDACNGEEICSYPGGCAPGVPVNCDDFDACTTDTCDPGSGCNYEVIDCDDGDDCNGNEDCDAENGCTAGEAVDCNDGDPCTIDSCEGGLCEHIPNLDPSCFPADAFCAVVGLAGSSASCQLRIARATNLTPLPAGAQYTIGYDSASLSLNEFSDETCVGPGGMPPCFPVTVPPNPLFPSGHSVIIVPVAPGDWSGSGNVFLANLSDPTSPVSSAYLSGGGVDGDPLVMTMELTLLADIPEEAPQYLYLSNVKGTTANAEDLTGSVQTGGLMVLSWPDCNDIAGICDDENECTTDTCNPINGSCEYSEVVCDNGQACDGEETCDVGLGCQGGAPLDCTDGDLCTDDSCDDGLGCVFTPVGCDDGDSCNGTETCEATSGACLPGTDQNCDDGDECTIDSCLNSACEYVPAPDQACFPAGAFCMVVGVSGSTATCELRLTRETLNTPVPVGAQFTIDFDDSVLDIDGLTDELCTGPGNTPPCMTIAVPPAALSPSGHTAIAVPEDFGDWAGVGHVFLLHLTDPTAAVSDSHLSGGGTSSDPLILTLHVSLTSDIDPATPSYLYLSNIKGTTQNADQLDGAVQTGGLMVLSWPDCNDILGICDDENACTADSCDSGGDCTFDTIECDDSDACNGAETCEPLSGCVSPGLDCDDGNACTVDSCDSALGCVHTTIDCDDQDACTGTETCDPESGCAAGIPPVCNDGNDCTVDNCVPESGCLFVDDLSSVCLPDGVLCKLVGIPGTQFVCDVRMTRESAEVPLIVSAFFGLSYNGFAVQLIAFEDAVCFGPGGGDPCTTFDVPPDVLDPSGHEVDLTPPSPLSAWPGAGSVAIVHPTDGTMEINDSTWDGGAPTGDTLVMRLRGQLLANIPPTAPQGIVIEEPTGEDELGSLLPGSTTEGTMVMTSGGGD